MTAEKSPAAPLVPSEVDLRDFTFMPLDVVRLRDSGLTAKATGDEFRCAVLLWCASWHQQPAASLPDDDQELANLCGYGRAPKEWRKVRAGALRGFVKCSDDRLYHPAVAAKALEAWEGKLAQRWRTECSRIKKHNQRHGLDAANAVLIPDFDTWKSRGCPQGQPLPVPEDNRSMSQGQPPNVPRETHSKGQGEGQGEGQGQGQGDLDELNTATSVEVAGARPPAEPPPTRQLALVNPPQPQAPKGPPDCPHQAVLALWAEVLPHLPQHLADQWRGTRADHLRARWRETATAKGWQSQDDGLRYLRKLFAYVGQSPFLTGRDHAPGKRPFVIELEWLVNPTNWAKVHEGKYHPEQEHA